MKKAAIILGTLLIMGTISNANEEAIDQLNRDLVKLQINMVDGDTRLLDSIGELTKNDIAITETIFDVRESIESNREEIDSVAVKSTIMASENYDDIVKNSGEIEVVKGDLQEHKEISDRAIARLQSGTKEVADTKVLAETNEKNIANNKGEIQNNSEKINNLDNRVNNLQGEMNKGFAMSAAMSNVDFQTLEVGELGIGAGVGNYQNAQAISFGLGLRATENLSMNVKGAMSTGIKQETVIGAGATYKIRVCGS